MHPQSELVCNLILLTLTYAQRSGFQSNPGAISNQWSTLQPETWRLRDSADQLRIRWPTSRIDGETSKS